MAIQYIGNDMTFGSYIDSLGDVTNSAPKQTKDQREAAEAQKPKTTTVSPTGPNVQFANKTKEDREASTAYKTTATTAAAPAKGDWVKLALQLGAAYLLLS